MSSYTYKMQYIAIKGLKIKKKTINKFRLFKVLHKFQQTNREQCINQIKQKAGTIDEHFQIWHVMSKMMAVILEHLMNLCYKCQSSQKNNRSQRRMLNYVVQKKMKISKFLDVLFALNIQKQNIQYSYNVEKCSFGYFTSQEIVKTAPLRTSLFSLYSYPRESYQPGLGGYVAGYVGYSMESSSRRKVYYSSPACSIYKNTKVRVTKAVDKIYNYLHSISLKIK